MTYEQTAAFDGSRLNEWFDGADKIVPSMASSAAKLLEEVRIALERDLGAARDGAARLAALLNTKPADPGPQLYARGGFAPWQVRRIKAYMSEHLESSILIETLASVVSLSASHFSRAFKESFGKTPHAYLTRLRVERAQEMMITTREPLSQIALDCGLADQSHLSRVFRRDVGYTPSAWRRMHTSEA
jgi:transcriptional regulator GlxA family with amidase domain